MSHRRSQRREAGQASGSLVLLLVILCVGGAFNYHRNLQRERDSERIRPYKAYAVADLEALREAYRAELESSRRSFQSAQRARAGTARDAGSVGRNIAQFDRTAAASRSIRDAASQVAQREGQIAELDREIRLRSDLGQGLMRHLRRLTTI